MPKGDPKRIQNAIDYQGGTASNLLGNQRERGLQQNQQFWNNYQTGVGRQMGDYSNLMDQYSAIRDRPDFTMPGTQYQGNINQALGGYGNFAQTGGFSPQDIQDIRARSIAPTRAAYANANREVDRQRALSGGNPNVAIAARAKMAREQGQALADANTNANAAIAQMTQQGKLAGLQGLGGLSSQLGMNEMGLKNQIDQQNLARLFGAAEGQRGVYGTNPALANMFGNQLLQSTGQGIDVEGLQGRLAQMIISGQLGRGQMPSRWDAFKSFASGLGDIGSMFAGVGGAFRGGQ